MKRRTRKNPDTLTTVFMLASLAGSALVAYLLLRKKPVPLGTTLVATTGQTFVTSDAPLNLGAFKDASNFDTDTCLLVKSGVAGFTVPGIPAGENTPMRVFSIATATAIVVQALALDPRVPANTILQVPVAAIAGAGDCSTGFN